MRTPGKAGRWFPAASPFSAQTQTGGSSEPRPAFQQQLRLTRRRRRSPAEPRCVSGTGRPERPTGRRSAGSARSRWGSRNSPARCGTQRSHQVSRFSSDSQGASWLLPPYFNSCAMAAICSTRSWCAARSLSNASCFFSSALISDSVAVS